MAVIGSTSLPIGGRDANFDGGAARARIVDFYTSNGKTNWAQVKKGFFWVVPGKENLKTGYRLGFTDIVDGKLVALPHGLFAVAGGHGVTRTTGIPAADKTKIKKKVNTYYRKMKTKFPNDKFDFDPPFPEVKEETDMADIAEISSLNTKTGKYEVIGEVEIVGEVKEFEDDRIEPLFKELMEKFYPIMGNATSFADLAGVEAIRQAINKAFKTVYDFEMLAHSVARKSESPGELVSGLKSLTDEMGQIFAKMSFDKDGNVVDKSQDTALTNFINTSLEEGEDWQINQKGSGALLKNAKGDQFFYGRFTNNLWDKDDEVLITEAHQEFVDYLDSHPDEAPELWDWHEADTAKTNRAIWWDFADGFLHSIWPVTSEEAKGIENFMEEFEPGMSHGFKVLERKSDDPRQIGRYRTCEASILPLEFAANEWTTFKIIMEQKQHDLVTKRKEQRQKMFSPEKQRALELLSLGKYTAPLGKASEEDAAALDQAGAQRKDKQQTDDNKGKGKTMADQVIADESIVENAPDSTGAETTEEVVATTETVEATVEATLEALQASTVDGFNLIMGQLKEIATQVQANTAALKGIKEKKGESPSVAAWVAAQKAETSIGHEADAETGDKGGPGSGRKKPPNGQVTDNDPLFGAGPEEEPFEINGHLLNSL